MSRPNHIVEPEELMAYLDGELPAEEALDTAEHLEHCDECQKLAAELKEVSRMLMAWEVEEGKESPSDRNALELDKKRQEKPHDILLERRPRFRLPTPRQALWGGAVAVSVLIIFAISIPSLLRSRMLSKEATPASRARTEAIRLGLQDVIRQSAKSEQQRQRTMPTSAPVQGKAGTIAESDGRGTAGKLTSDRIAANENYDQFGGEQEKPQESPVDSAVDLKNPMVIRTADLAITVKEFEKARSAVDEILNRHNGHVGDLNVNTPSGEARSLTVTLRVPSNRLDAALSDLKILGRVEKESQSGEEVTQQYVDLQARLANSKHTEERLTEILRERTGKLSDVLAVEVQISRVRGEIEQMEAQRKTMKNQVDFATLNLTLTEEYKKELNVAPPSTGTQFRNAAIDGYRSLVDGVIAVLLWLFSVGPSLLLWIGVLFFPARMAWRRIAVIARDRRHRA